MKILVCLKQVPDATHVDIDSETGNLKREGADNKVNLYDLYALEAAVKLREQTGGKITAVSMGPPQAERAVREALMLGADEGVLLSDRAFAGSDVLATSYTIYQAVKTLGGFDLIICGKQTSDGDTAQVGPALAELLDIPHAAWVKDILESDDEKITIRQDLGDTLLDVSMRCPCLITVEKSKSIPQLPSYMRKKQFASIQIRVLTLHDFDDKDVSKYGGNGSPTRVERIFPPPVNTEKTMLAGTPEKQANGIYTALLQRKFIGEGK